MNPRSLKPILVITVAALAVALSLVHAPKAMAGGASGGPGILSGSAGGAGMVSRDAKMAEIRREYQLEVARIYLDEGGVVASHILAAIINPPGYILSWSISTTLRASGVLPKETPQPTLLRMSAPFIPGYDIMFSAEKVE